VRSVRSHTSVARPVIEPITKPIAQPTTAPRGGGGVVPPEGLGTLTQLGLDGAIDGALTGVL